MGIICPASLPFRFSTFVWILQQSWLLPCPNLVEGLLLLCLVSLSLFAQHHGRILQKELCALNTWMSGLSSFLGLGKTLPVSSFEYLPHKFPWEPEKIFPPPTYPPLYLHWFFRQIRYKLACIWHDLLGKLHPKENMLGIVLVLSTSSVLASELCYLVPQKVTHSPIFPGGRWGWKERLNNPNMCLPYRTLTQVSASLQSSSPRPDFQAFHVSFYAVMLTGRLRKTIWALATWFITQLRLVQS